MVRCACDILVLRAFIRMQLFFSGLFIQQIETDNYTANITYYAHRKYVRLLVTSVDIRRADSVAGDVAVTLETTRGPESTDFTWKHQRNALNDTHKDTQ